MVTCMNGLTRLSLSLVGTFWKYLVVKRPRTSSGKRRPCGTLLQLVVVNLNEMHSISRSVDAVILVAAEQPCNTTHFVLSLLILYEDSSRRAVWLGRCPVEKISIGPKDKLIQLGNLELSAKAKACLTVFWTAKNAGAKAGLSEPTCFFNRSRVW